MYVNQSSLFYNETVVISDLFSANIRKKNQKAWFSEQFRICPGCTRIVRFVKASSDSLEFRADPKFLFEDFEYIIKPQLFQSEERMRKEASIQILTSMFNDGEEIDTMEDFKNHVSSCLSSNQNPFQVEDGIWNVDDFAPKFEQRMINLMYFFSKKENNYHYDVSGLWGGNDYRFKWTPSHLLVENGIPVGYCAVSHFFAFSKENSWLFSEEEPDENNNILIPRQLMQISVEGYHHHGEMCLIHDLYVFADFRKRGFARKILDSLLDGDNVSVIEIDTDYLLLTDPVSSHSERVFSSFSTDKIVRVSFDPHMKGVSAPRGRLI